MGILDKDTIEKRIVPHLEVGRRGFKLRFPVVDMFSAILHRLKTGSQWRYLPLKESFGDSLLSWNAVFYHFNKWSKSSCWRQVWVNLPGANHGCPDLSNAILDGNHMPAKNGGAVVGYRERKAWTTNDLFLCDNQSLLLSMSTSQGGRHHDLFQIKVLFREMCRLPKDAGIDTGGLFLNAAPGFDGESFRQTCGDENISANVKPNPRNPIANDGQAYQSGEHVFDEELYERKNAIERANA